MYIYIHPPRPTRILVYIFRRYVCMLLSDTLRLMLAHSLLPRLYRVVYQLTLFSMPRVYTPGKCTDTHTVEY